MTIHITPEIERLAADLAALSGLPADEALLRALREAHARVEAKREVQEAILRGHEEFKAFVRSQPVIDPTVTDESFLYGEDGLPA